MRGWSSRWKFGNGKHFKTCRYLKIFFYNQYIKDNCFLNHNIVSRYYNEILLPNLSLKALKFCGKQKEKKILICIYLLIMKKKKYKYVSTVIDPSKWIFSIMLLVRKFN